LRCLKRSSRSVTGCFPFEPAAIVVNAPRRVEPRRLLCARSGRRPVRIGAKRNFSRQALVHKSNILPHCSPLIVLASSSARSGAPLHGKGIASVPGGARMAIPSKSRGSNGRDCKCSNNCGDRDAVRFCDHGDVSSRFMRPSLDSNRSAGASSASADRTEPFGQIEICGRVSR